MTTPPELLDEVKWLGIKIVSCANNHSYDYGEAGLLATLRHLDAAGIPHSGSGRNLAEARAPAYLETPRGRIALVSMTATFRPWNRASAQRPDMVGRPGINPFGFTTSYTVDRAAMGELRRIAKSLGFEKAMARDRRHFYSDRILAPPTQPRRLRCSAIGSSPATRLPSTPRPIPTTGTAICNGSATRAARRIG